VVMARDDLPGGLGLAAYLVARPGAEIALDELRVFLSARLPEYMLPAAFVILPELPLRSSGKVDRRALPVPVRGGVAGAGEREPIAPRTPVEGLLAEIWSDLLNLDRVSVFDSFFQLGGHSLLATQLVAKVRGAFQVELPLRRLFETPTVAAAAAAITAVGAAEGKPGQIDKIARILLRVRRLAAEKRLTEAGEAGDAADAGDAGGMDEDAVPAGPAGR